MTQHSVLQSALKAIDPWEISLLLFIYWCLTTLSQSGSYRVGNRFTGKQKFGLPGGCLKWKIREQKMGHLKTSTDYAAIAEHCNLWRNYRDIQDSWAMMYDIIQFYGKNPDNFSDYAGPGNWNDPDQLIIGDFSLSYTQEKVQMGMWTIMASPLFMSTDLREIRPESKELLLNERLLAINQDKLGVQGTRLLKSLYRTQVKELKEEIEDKQKHLQEISSDFKTIEQEKESICAQLQLAIAKADSEQLARSIAEEQLSDVEKEKTMLELEIKELMSRHKVDMSKKESVVNVLEGSKRDYVKSIEQMQSDKDDLNTMIKKLTDDIRNMKSESSETDNKIELLKKQLEEEKTKKIQAINKLAGIMNRKDFRNKTKKNHAVDSELRKMQKDYKKLQQEISMEKEKYGKMVERLQRDMSEMQAALYEEGQQRGKLQMELDAKDSEIEQLQQKLAYMNIDSTSLNSATLDESCDENNTSTSTNAGETYMEGWLAVPNRSNIKKYGWRKQYVVVSSKKVIFYNTENDKMNADPMLVLDLDKLFHARPVSPGDVYRADAKDIPRIFQILYATEGENRKPDETEDPNNPDRTNGLAYKGHDFFQLHFRTPTTCDSCNEPVWDVLHPPQALECKRCHVKVHKDHFDKNEEFIASCKVNYDTSIQAKELLLLAESSDKQKTWVQHLGKKVTRKGIINVTNSGTGPSRGTRQYSSFGPQQRHQLVGKSTTLPANAAPPRS